MIDYAIIGKRLKDARISHNLTQAELANEIGVSTGYICQVESGDKCFNLKRLEKIAELFGKPITYFIGEAGGDIRATMIAEIVEILSKMSGEKLDKAVKMLNIIAE